MKLTYDVVLLAIAYNQAVAENHNQFVHSRFQKWFYNHLSELERRRRQRQIPLSALLLPSQSAWRRAYHANCNQAMITLTGLDCATFAFILQDFEFCFDNYSPYSMDGTIFRVEKFGRRKGRPRLVQASDALGLVLVWTRTRGSKFVLEVIFGMTQTCVSLYLSFSIVLLISVLQGNEDAKIRRPSIEKIQQYQHAVASRHPGLADVWCAMDGLKLLIESAGDDDEQNCYYNGWTCDHYVNAVLVFCPDGTIPICCYNVPGTVHDSMVAVVGKIYAKLESVFETCGARCVVDSAFARNNYPFLVKSEKPTVTMTPAEMRLAAEATSMRQSAEWGMRTFQSSFPRVKDRIEFESIGQRKQMMKLMILLFNLRARRVGINQILNVYMPALILDVNEIIG